MLVICQVQALNLLPNLFSSADEETRAPWRGHGSLIAVTMLLFLLIQTDTVIFITYEDLRDLQSSCSVVSDSLRPHGLQHTSLPNSPRGLGAPVLMCGIWSVLILKIHHMLT